MKSKLSRGIALVVSAVVIVTLTFLLLPHKSHFPTLPDPNGYDVLVKEAAKIIRHPSGITDMTSNQLAAFVVSNEAAVVSLRQALNLPSILPVQLNEKWVSGQQLQNRINLRAAATAMDAQARLWWLRGDSTNALALYVDQMRLGHAMMRGGVHIDYLLGSAVEVWASSRLTNLLADLNADQCKRATDLLSELDSQRETFEEFTNRELEWQRKSYSVLHRLKAGFSKHVLRESDPFAGMAGNSGEEYKRRTLEFRRILLRLAVRACELEKGSRPSSASELVPAYLKEIPVNPQKGAPLELP